MGVIAPQQLGHRGRVELGVVHASDHRDLVRDAPPGGRRVVARGGDDLGDRPPPVERHQHVAQRIARGMERDRQRELWSERGQPPDAGHDPGGRDRDMARAEAEPAAVVQRLDGGQHPVEVEQGLTHAHEHDVGEPLPGRDQPARRETYLVDDLGHPEVAPEAELAGRAEWAADRAAGLARDAQRVPFARTGPRRIMHQDRLDEGAIGEPMERLLGQAAVRLAHLGIGDGVEAERSIEGLAQWGRKRPDVGRAPRIAAPNRVADLARSVGRLPACGEPGGQHVRGQAGDPRSFVKCHESDASAAVPTIPVCPRRNASQGMRLPPAGWTSNTPLAVSPDVPGLADQTAMRPTAVSMKEPGHG